MLALIFLIFFLNVPWNRNLWLILPREEKEKWKQLQIHFEAKYRLSAVWPATPSEIKKPATSQLQASKKIPIFVPLGFAPRQQQSKQQQPQTKGAATAFTILIRSNCLRVIGVNFTLAGIRA